MHRRPSNKGELLLASCLRKVKATTRSQGLLCLRELHTLPPALAQFGRTLALVDHAGLLKEATVTHFVDDSTALNDLIEAPQGRLKGLSFLDNDASHSITFFFAWSLAQRPHEIIQHPLAEVGQPG